MVLSRALMLLLSCGLVTPAAAQLRYQLELSDDARQLRVSVCSDSPLAGGMLMAGDGRGHAHILDIEGDAASRPQLRGRQIEHGALAAGQCLRYRVDAFAAAAEDRYRLSWRENAHLMLPLSAWLWRPPIIPDGSELRLRLPAGWSASLPFVPLAGPGEDGGRYRLSHTPLDWDGSSAFGRFSEQRVELAGGVLRVAVLTPATPAEVDRVQRWVRQGAAALLQAYGRLPLADVQVLVVPLPGNATPVPWGQVLRAGGSALKLFVGLDASESALRDDWTLAHELSHLLHPYLRSSGRWLSEGLASYYQNVLRARAGMLTAEQAWQRLDAGFVRGRDERGSRGHALSAAAVGGRRSTMRVYWSGAAFWLEADLALRQRHGLGVDQLLATFARQHLPSRRQWEPERFVAELDRLAGSELLLPQFQRYRRGLEFPQLGDAYRQLGMGSGIGQLALDDAASGAAIRAAIMRGPAELRGQTGVEAPASVLSGTMDASQHP
jgi:hypothetical protein